MRPTTSTALSKRKPRPMTQHSPRSAVGRNRATGCGSFFLRSQDSATAPLRSIMRSQRLMKRSEEHTSELQSLMRISYAVFCLKKKIYNTENHTEKDNSSFCVLQPSTNSK